ncbi:hypothetical protein H0H81_007117 [Sphagnurus paluster]|uniref:Rpr2-domain-containing protein n=1 Tax=Sphagnurus paluster TaxID=117069 RepID=A0A9P7KKM1_9AGAR|nr:hypothetical protein H0H81_007117 [Sphagnurus paluster]
MGHLPFDASATPEYRAVLCFQAIIEDIDDRLPSAAYAMAKKGKDETPTANSAANRDIIQRLNFLYQASTYLNTLPPGTTSTPNPPNPKTSTNATPDKPPRKMYSEKGSMTAAKRTVTASDLAKTYIATMKTVGQKTTVKMDPAVKRTLCKGCNMTLIPGATASVRVKKSPAHGHIMVYTCTSCKTSRRIPAPPTLHTAEHTPPSTYTSGPILDVGTASQKGRRKHQRKSVQARIPPLFAREVGHVVFRGSEQLVEDGQGNGVFIT